MSTHKRIPPPDVPRRAASGVWKPAPQEVLAAQGKTVPDVIGPSLRVLFCGINPSLYSAAVGHHFARPGNRFWPTLHAAGFTGRVLSPFEDEALVGLDLGITNLVGRATATAAELTPDELLRGGQQLERMVRRYPPRYLAVLGVSAYRSAFSQPKAVLGLQELKLGGANVWVLPNPSGLNAHYQLADLAKLFGSLRLAAYGV